MRLYKVAGFVFLFTILVFSGCKFYKAREKPPKYPVVANIDRYTPTRYTFIVHFGAELWQLSSVQLYTTADYISGKMNRSDPDILKVSSGIEPGRTKRYKGENAYARQVHLFIREYKDLENGLISIYGKDIEKVIVYNIDGVATVLSYMVGSGLTFIGAVAVFVAIACNCPHVYTYDGDSYQFEATLFTGAVAPGLERNDYKILPDYQTNSDEYKLRIVNEELEDQYTNLLELIVVAHPKGVMAVPDQVGGIHLFDQPVTVTSAVAGNRDVLEEVKLRDDLPFGFDTDGEEDLADIELTFSVPGDAPNANLVLRLKNTAWGGYVYKDFISNFGHTYGRWVDKNVKQVDNFKQDWSRAQGIPLNVEILEESGWTNAGYVDLVGEVDYTTLVVPLTLRSNLKEEIRIRLTAGFKFWELDYAALDYKNLIDPEVRILKPTSAVGNTGKDFSRELDGDDDTFMNHLETGDFTEVSFGPIESTNEARTLILRSKGYYVSDYTFPGQRRLGKLVRYRKPGELSRRSRELFEEFGNSVTVTQNDPDR